MRNGKMGIFSVKWSQFDDPRSIQSGVNTEDKVNVLNRINFRIFQRTQVDGSYQYPGARVPSDI